MVYDGGHFEIMVMSWRPGDFSAIHDHGYTQWGAVQIFGPAEHATFRVEEDQIFTLSRQIVSPGDIVGVSHSLVHQMGNPTNEVFFLSLHVYGNVQSRDSVTGDARLYDLENEVIQRVDGGVFFALPEKELKSTEKGPKPDFPTRLRHMVELIRRLRKMENRFPGQYHDRLEEAIAKTYSTKLHPWLLHCLDKNSDANGHQSNSVFWRILNNELKEAAKLQNELRGAQGAADNFHQYAQLYDGVIGQPCLDGFMRKYLFFFQEKYQIDFSNQSLISLGCGTGPY